MANTVLENKLPPEAEEAAEQNPHGVADPLTAPISAVCDSIVADIERVKLDTSKTKQNLYKARKAIRKERFRLFGLIAALPRRPPIVSERGETALAQVVLAAQQRAKGEQAESWPLFKRLRKKSAAG